jgi:hypothetical protein
LGRDLGHFLPHFQQFARGKSRFVALQRLALFVHMGSDGWKPALFRPLVIDTPALSTEDRGGMALKADGMLGDLGNPVGWMTPLYAFYQSTN